MVKNPAAMQETGVRPLGQDEPLEKGMATHSSCSCLGNAMDIGAQRAIVHGVTNSQTRLGTHSLHEKGLLGGSRSSPEGPKTRRRPGNRVWVGSLGSRNPSGGAGGAQARTP